MPKVTIDSVPLGAHGGIAWTLYGGTDPLTLDITVSNRVAGLLAGKECQPLTLIIESGHKPKVHTTVYLLEILPGGDHATSVLRLADRRWMWQRKIVAKSFNIRRKSTETRLNLSAGAPLEMGELATDVKYMPMTLMDYSRVYTPREILTSILEAVDPDAEKQIPNDLPDYTIENLDTQGNTGNTAIARAMAFLPGYRIFISADDKIVVSNKFGKEHEDSVKSIKWHLNRGAVRHVQRAKYRPKHVDVYFEREVELRFDFRASYYGRSIARNDEPLQLQNVIQVPDIYIEFDGKKYWRGTYMVMEEYLQAIRGTENFPEYPVNKTNINRWWAGGLSQLMSFQSLDRTTGAPDKIWTARINAIRRDYRQLFRLLPPWRDRFYTLTAKRAGILDYENGIFAPAECFCDYMSKYTIRGAASAIADGANGAFVEGYAANISDSTVCPVAVDVVHNDAGIIRITPRGDTWGMREGLIFGKPVMAVPALLDLVKGAAAKPLAWEHVVCEDDWDCAIVLTATPAAPNSKKRLYKYRVKPDDLRDYGLNIGECKGPPIEAYVGGAGGWWTARTGWHDGSSEQIRRAFLGDDGFPDDLLLNKDHLTALAKSTAAMIYEPMLDRVEGGGSMPLDGTMQPVGGIDRVSHTVRTTGQTATRVSVPKIAIPRPMWSYLPASVRKQLLRQVAE